MPHSFSSDFRLGHLHATAITDNAAEADSLVFSAVALPVLDRTEGPFAEEPVSFRLKSAVVNSLRLGHFSVRPGANSLRRSQLNSNSLKITRLSCGSGEYFYHFRISFGLKGIRTLFPAITDKQFVLNFELVIISK